MPTNPKSSIKINVKPTLSRAAGILLLILGAAALITSIIYVSQIPAFIGLGLVFWGTILTYIQTGEYVKETVLDATATALLATLEQTLKELDFKGQPVYLPPKYLNNPETARVYLPKLRSGKPPAPEQTRKLETQPPSRISQAMFLTPPGAELARLFEETLNTSFTRVDLNYLQENLPRLLIENLEIASNVEMQTGTSTTSTPLDNTITQIAIAHDKINVKITSTAYKNTAKELAQPTSIIATLGSPLTSAIACAIAKATGKPTVIETQQASEDGETVQVEYRMLEEE
jgi:hypothetical protein